MLKDGSASFSLVFKSFNLHPLLLQSTYMQVLGFKSIYCYFKVSFEDNPVLENIVQYIDAVVEEGKLILRTAERDRERE